MRGLRKAEERMLAHLTEEKRQLMVVALRRCTSSLETRTDQGVNGE